MNACPWCAPLGGALEEPTIFGQVAREFSLELRDQLGLVPVVEHWDPDVTEVIPAIRAEILDNG